MTRPDLFDAAGNPHSALIQTLDRCNVSHNGTLQGICNATQQAWYQEGKLRAEIKDTQADAVLRPELWPLFTELGFVHEVHASREHYRTAGVLGATLIAVRKRLRYLIAEFERGVRFDQLVLFGGTRPLMKDREGPEAMLKVDNAELPVKDGWHAPTTLPTTEMGMMKLVHSQATYPNGFPSEKITFVEATGDTRATLKAWQTPESDSLLSSSNPFISYQQQVARRVLHSLQIDCIGYAAADTTPIATMLDNLAKLIYELAERG